MATIIIRKEKIEKQKGVVILPLKEYERLLVSAVPTYYLTGKAAERVDKLVDRGLREYRVGKATKADSITEALKINRQRHGR